MRAAGLVVGLGAALLGTACGTTSSTNAANPPAASPAVSPSAASSPAIPCGQIRALRGSLTSLAHVALQGGSAGQIGAQLSVVEAHLVMLKGQAGQAGGMFATQANQLVNALKRVGKAAHAVSMSPSQANMTALSAALSGLRAKVPPMISEMQAVCPGA
jgi:hypothetical protein